MDTTTTTYLDRYQLCTGENGTPVTLQRGPGGVTYKAADLRSGREVAVKLVPSYSFAPAQLKQLEVEAKAAQLVENPNVARLYDFGLAGGDVVFVTEVLDGSTLDAWVSEHGPLPAAAVVRVALQVVGGLAAAAFHSVVHRSIRPASLMIVPGQTPEGEWPFVKVLDFGGVPPTSSASEFSVRSAGSSADFASPEQLKGYPVDFRSELYSLGCTLWYLLTGAPPIPGTADKGNRIPKALRPILAQMVALDPMQRPQDPVLLQGQLRDCLAVLDRREATARKFGMPVAAPVTPTREASRNTMALLKPVAFAAAILLLVGIAATALPHLLRTRTTVSEPIGVPVGVPDASAAPAVAAADTPAAVPSSAPERTPGETDVAESGSTTSPGATASATPADETANALVSITPPVPPASVATSLGSGSTAEPPVVAANTDADSSRAADNIETPAPQEPATTSTAITSVPREGVAPESTQSRDSDSSVSADDSTTSTAREATAATVPSSTPAKETTIAKSKPKRAEPIRRKEVRPAQPVTDSDFVNAPPIPRGAKRARYLGTTPDGNLVFGLPSNERVFVAPPAYQPDQRRSRRQRRAAPTPEPQREMVLPAEPVDPQDE